VRRIFGPLFLVSALLLSGTTAFAQAQVGATQFGQPADNKGAKLGEAVTQEYRVGVIVSADSGECKGILATNSVPIDWPEQRVKISQEEVSPLARSVEYDMVGTAVKQMVINIPYIPPAEQCKVLVTFEVTRHSILPPDNTAIFNIPKKLDKETRTYLAASPFIETQNPKFKSVAREAMAGKSTAWEKVEALYDWTREKIQYKEIPAKGAVKAMREGEGNHEDISGVFIALCRVSDIPARTVWIPRYCYPEFYLEDDAGKGYWFPCQPVGVKSFGGISEHRPILQKGDNFRVPDRPKEKQRFVSEFLSGQGGKPTVKFIRELVGAAQ
jgi:hypothetical protein